MENNIKRCPLCGTLIVHTKDEICTVCANEMFKDVKIEIPEQNLYLQYFKNIFSVIIISALTLFVLHQGEKVSPANVYTLIIAYFVILLISLIFYIFIKQKNYNNKRRNKTKNNK